WTCATLATSSEAICCCGMPRSCHGAGHGCRTGHIPRAPPATRSPLPVRSVAPRGCGAEPSRTGEPNMQISVIGTGYLGAVHAAGMAELGFDVVGVDVDPRRIEALSAGTAPFYEPDFEPLLAKHAGDRLRFTTDYAATAG